MNSRVDKSAWESGLDPAGLGPPLRCVPGSMLAQSAHPLRGPGQGGFPSDAPVSSGMTAGPLPVDHRAPKLIFTHPSHLTATYSLLRALCSRHGGHPSDRSNFCPRLRAFAPAVPSAWSVHRPRVPPGWLLRVIQVSPPKPALQSPAWIAV